MAIIQEFDLNLIPDSEAVVVKVNQYDIGAGRLVAHLYVNELTYTPASGATAKIEGTKPDDKGFSYTASLSGNTVTADLTEQMCAVEGRTRTQIVITETSGRTGTFVFWLEVQKSALGEDTDISETELPAIIDAARKNAERAETAADNAEQSAEEAATSAESAASSASAAAASASNAATSASQAAGSASQAASSASTATTKASEASTSANNASNYANIAKSWAVGPSGTGTSGTDSNNSKYWAEQAAQSASEAEQYAQGGLIYRGSIFFANIPTSNLKAGDMYNMEDDFTTDSRFQEGSGKSVKAGSNIAWNGTKWDVLAIGGGDVTGVKGNSESTYRKGNVNLTPANIGLGNVNNTSDANKPVSTATQTALNNKSNLSNLATIETTTTASKAYAVGDYLVYNGQLYKVTAAIASGGTITVGTNVTATSITDNLGASITVDSALSSTSENPVQNKVINTALSGKRTTGAYDDASDTVTFTTADVSSDSSATSWTSVSQLTSGSTFATLLNRISAMMKNVRYLKNNLLLSNYYTQNTLSGNICNFSSFNLVKTVDLYGCVIGNIKCITGCLTFNNDFTINAGAHHSQQMATLTTNFRSSGTSQVNSVIGGSSESVTSGGTVLYTYCGVNRNSRFTFLIRNHTSAAITIYSGSLIVVSCTYL